jgi:tetratricopeptide (TPR) repeat protein
MFEKYMRPVITSLFFLLIILLAMTRYADFDLWWHMKLGQSIVENKGLFSIDAFSYTFAGLHQYTGEWLADLLIFMSHSIGGFAGVNILKALVLLVTFYFLHKAAMESGTDRRGAFLASAVTLLTVLFAIRFRLFVRPYIFSFVFVAFFLFVLEYSRKKPETRLLYLLPVAQVLWVNMSVGGIFGPLIAFFYLFEDTIRNKETFRKNIVLLGLTTVATLASPETWGVYTLTLGLFTDPFKAVVGEYQPLSAQILWGFGLRYTWGYQILVALSLIYFIMFKGWRNLAHILLFVFFLIETILQVRMIEFFALISAPMAAVPLGRLFSSVSGKNGARYPTMACATAFLIAIAIPLSIYGNKTYPFGNGVKEDTFPQEALSFLDQQGISGKMFNGYSIGGYIIWRSPNRKVFFDGRYRRLYSSEFYKEYTSMMEDAAAWKAGEERYGFDHAVIEYEQLSRRFPLHLNDNPGWALVYWDNHSAVYLKRVPKFERLIAAREYRLVKPNFYDFSYLTNKSTKDQKTFLADLQRDIDLNPANQEPVLAKALVLYDMGRQYRGEVETLLNDAIKLKPDLGMKHSAKAYLLMEQGKPDAAREEVLKAVELDPTDQGAWELGKKLGLKLKVPKGVHP